MEATWFKPADLLDIRRRNISKQRNEPFYRYVARFGLQYTMRITHPPTDEEAQEYYQLDVQNALYLMEDELMKWIIKQWGEHSTEKIHGFIMVDTPHIPEGKPVLLVHPADRQKLFNQITSFQFRFNFPKPLKEALKDG